MDYRRAVREFEGHFGSGAGIRVARAPYRTCPIGAHTDHQLGLVIGFTTEPAIHLVFRRRADRMVRARSGRFPGEAAFEIGATAGGGVPEACVLPQPASQFGDPSFLPQPASQFGDPSFAGYLRAIAARAAAEHPIAAGLDGWIAGDLAPGGVASSAALQVAFLFALLDANGVRPNRAAMMKLVVSAEHEAGVSVGLLDPAVILFGERGHVVFLDCREGLPRVQELPASLPPFEFMLVDSGVARDLRESPYNARVAECRAAAVALGATGDPPSLREVTLEDLRLGRKNLDPTLARRAEHVLSENKRVRIGLAALQQGDLRAFGRLVSASGQSMVRFFDAGTPETSALLGILQADPAVLGATLGGAGFGGSLLAIVPKGGAAAAFARARAAFAARFPEAASRAACTTSGTGDGPAVASAGG